VSPAAGHGRWRPPRGVLAELIAGAREDLARRRRDRPRLVAELASRPRPRPRFAEALRVGSGFAVIAEVKQASPSAGAIHSVEVAAQAEAYARGGARCVSVLTEGRRFGGSLEDLRRVRQAVDLPLLRKDFLVDPYMLAEAAQAGAEAVLLIAGAVPPEELRALDAAATGLGLDVLVEVVHPFELPSLEGLAAPLVGVNARDLETLEVDPDRFARLAPSLVGPGRLLVAESGIRGPDDIRRLSRAGAGACLVGETLMRAADPEAAVRSLVEAR
jgi:indole-3-glycerol phosphate synthase